MKISDLLALSFLLFAFTTLSMPSAGADETVNGPVYDIFGHPLTTEHVYYIYGTQYNNSTNLEVTLANESTGIPPRLKLFSIGDTQRVAISHAETANDSFIRMATNLNFQFNFSYDDLSTKWKVGQNTSEKQWFVTIGGHDSDDWFQICEYKDTANYQLLYCPKPQPNCECDCVVVGLVVKDGVSYLSPNSDLDPFPLAFGRAEDVPPA